MGDYRSNKEFLEIVRKCFVDIVDVIYTADDYDPYEAADMIKGISLFTQAIAYAVEKGVTPNV